MGMSLLRHQAERRFKKNIEIEFIDGPLLVVEAEQRVRMRVSRGNISSFERFKIYFESVSESRIEVGAGTHHLAFHPGEETIELAWPAVIGPEIESGIYQFSFILESDSGRIRLVKQLVLLRRASRRGSLSKRTNHVRLFSMASFLAALPADPTHH